jgi:hypothetical protein
VLQTHFIIYFNNYKTRPPKQLITSITMYTAAHFDESIRKYVKFNPTADQFSQMTSHINLSFNNSFVIEEMISEE